MNVAIIGCGKWCLDGEITKHWINNGATITALCDLEYSNVKKLLERENELKQKLPKVFWGENGFLELINHNHFDVIAVLTNPMSRCQILKQLIQKEISFFVEKPLCANLEQAIEIYKLYREQNIFDKPGKLPITSTGLSGRSPAFVFLKKKIESKVYGKLKALHFSYGWKWNFTDKSDWRGNPDLGGGHIKEKFIHHLDALYWSLGPISEVSAIGTRLDENPKVWNNFSGNF